MDIPNPPETERVWLTALENEYAKCEANLKTMTAQAGALTPEQIVGLLNYTHTLDQYFITYAPTAEALSSLGLPNLKQRLATVQQDLHQSIAVYSEMYRSAITFRSNLEQMQRDAAAQMFKANQETYLHTQAVYDQTNRLYNLVNEGVPYPEALALSRQPQ